jgi:lipopolysaccharide export system permease protein
VRLFRYVATRALVAFAGALSAVVALFLVVDFAENASIFRGPGWVGTVLEMYLAKAAVVAYQVAPAAMLLAASVAASGLRRTREYTALRALGLGPWRIAVPVLSVAVAVAVAIAVFDDTLVVDASRRVEEIMAVRFQRGGAWQRWHEPKRWFRGRDGRRIYHLRGSGVGGSFERVTVLEVAPGFRLARRIDAARMSPGPGGEWVLEGVEERTFRDDGRVEFARWDRRDYRFDEDPDSFSVLPGRPAQMRRATLLDQTRLRRRLGLPVAEFDLEWSNKLAYPLAGLSASLVALALALRRERKGHLTASLVESVGVSLVFWGFQGLGWSLGLSGRLAPQVASWAPDVIFLVAGLWAIRKSA